MIFYTMRVRYSSGTTLMNKAETAFYATNLILLRFFILLPLHRHSTPQMLHAYGVDLTDFPC